MAVGRAPALVTTLIAATASKALHVLDASLCHQEEISVRRPHTDGGDSERVLPSVPCLGSSLPRTSLISNTAIG
jgi:hypothetical protein